MTFTVDQIARAAEIAAQADPHFEQLQRVSIDTI